MQPELLLEERITDLHTKIKTLTKRLYSPSGDGELLYPNNEESILEYLRDKKVDEVMLTFVDIHAKNWKQFTVPIRELPSAFENGMGFDGSSIKGFRRIEESDMVFRPDPTSFSIIPFPVGGEAIATMFGDIYTPQGERFAGDPRNILRTTIEEAKEQHGFSHINIGPEPEFFLFNRNGESFPLPTNNSYRPEVLDNRGYFDAGMESFRSLFRTGLEAMGIQVEYHHHEVGSSQHEVDIKYKEAMKMADNLMRFRWLAKSLAEQLGLTATFMPKPFEEANGSGMHTHLSVFNEQGNMFFDETDDYHLSPFAYKFIGGVLDHAREIALITNPLTNSYKRLVPGFEAPVYIGWSRANRSCMVRIPDYRRGKEEATRIEIRNPDATANPYLYLSAIIQAGFRGVEKESTAPKPLNENLYTLSEEERIQRNIPVLPGDLGEAIREAEKSAFLEETLGSELMNNLLAEKSMEWSASRREVTPLDYSNALGF